MDYLQARQEQRRDDALDNIAKELREIRKTLQALLTALSRPDQVSGAAYRLDFVDGYMGAVGSYFSPNED